MFCVAFSCYIFSIDLIVGFVQSDLANVLQARSSDCGDHVVSVSVCGGADGGGDGDDDHDDDHDHDDNDDDEPPPPPGASY